MDMLFFPLNNMFSNNTAKDFSTFTYALKLNGNIVKITDDFYLKKDFSENSLQLFSKWIIADGNDLMTNLLERKITDSVKRSSYLKKLTPPESTIGTWPVWFVKFHKLPVVVGDEIEVWKYNFHLKEKAFILTDSTLVTEQIVTDEK